MKSVARLVSTGILGALIAVAAMGQLGQRPSMAELREMAGKIVKGQMIVQLQPGATVAQARKFATDNGLEYVSAMLVPDAFVLRIKDWQSAAMDSLTRARVAEVRTLPGVRFAGPNQIYITLETTPNDPLYSQQWGLRQMKVPQTWDFQKGKTGIVMCICDTSIETTHPDFQLPGGQSVLLPGYNASDKSTNPNPDPSWPDSHGTMCTSIAGAATNNGVGMAGVAFENIRIVPIRATDNPFFFPSNLLYDAYQFIIDYNNNAANATKKIGVVNLSLGGPSGASNTMEEDLINKIDASGAIVVAASGNSRGFDTAGFPASYAKAISIAATGNGGAIASYSSPGNGSPDSKVDFAAPGGDFGGPNEEMTVADMRATYTIGVGTSFAAPMATGAVALLLSQGVPKQQIYQTLQSAANTRGLPVPNNDYGYGEIDLFEALKRFGGSATFLSPKQNDIFEYRNVHIQVMLGNIDPSTVVLKDGTTVIPYGQLVTIDSIFKMIDTYHSFSTGTHTLTVTATSTINNKAIDPPATVTFQVTPHVQVAGTLMLALPYPFAGTPDTLFPGNFTLQRWVYQRDGNGNAVDAGAWYRWPNSYGSFSPPDAYVHQDETGLDAVPLGVGYFLTLGVATPIIVEDGPDTTRAYRIGINPGWQMIGNPFPFTIDWNTVEVDTINQRLTMQQAIDQEYLRPQIFRWSPVTLDYSWRSAPGGQLYPWESHWVYCRKPCKLVVHPIPTSNRGPLLDGPMVSPDGWALRLKAIAGSVGDTYNYVGATSTPRAAYDLVSKAPSPVDSVRLSILSTDGKQSFAQSIKDVRSRSQEWTIAVTAPSGQSNVSLEWDSIVESTKKVTYTLVDVSTGRRLSMNATTTYQFTTNDDGTPRKFRIIASQDAGAKLVVTGVKVSSSNGRAGTSHTVSYLLSKEAQVQVTILSLTGKRIAVVQSGSRGVGFNNATWTGRDDAGISVPPGTYMVEISATGTNGEQVRTVSPLVLKR